MYYRETGNFRTCRIFNRKILIANAKTPYHSMGLVVALRWKSPQFPYLASSQPSSGDATANVCYWPVCGCIDEAILYNPARVWLSFSPSISDSISFSPSISITRSISSCSFMKSLSHSVIFYPYTVTRSLSLPLSFSLSPPLSLCVFPIFPFHIFQCLYPSLIF